MTVCAPSDSCLDRTRRTRSRRQNGRARARFQALLRSARSRDAGVHSGDLQHDMVRDRSCSRSRSRSYVGRGRDHRHHRRRRRRPGPRQCSRRRRSRPGRSSSAPVKREFQHRSSASGNVHVAPRRHRFQKLEGPRKIFFFFASPDTLASESMSRG